MTKTGSGFALQLGTVRYLGTFLPDPFDVPWPAVEYLAAQLGVADVSVAKRYAERLPAQHEHVREIRQAYGYRDLSDADAAAGLREFLDGRAWTHAEGPYRLFGQAAGRLRRNRVLASATLRQLNLAVMQILLPHHARHDPGEPVMSPTAPKRRRKIPKFRAVTRLRRQRKPAPGTAEPATVSRPAPVLQVLIFSNTDLPEPEFSAQTDKIRPVASYDSVHRSWYSHLPVDRPERAAEVLTALFEAARLYRTTIQVRVQPAGQDSPSGQAPGEET